MDGTRSRVSRLRTSLAVVADVVARSEALVARTKAILDEPSPSTFLGLRRLSEAPPEEKTIPKTGIRCGGTSFGATPILDPRGGATACLYPCRGCGHTFFAVPGQVRRPLS